MPQVQKANPCLKRIFYVFNGLYAITGCLLFIVAIAGSALSAGNQIGMAVIYVLAVGFMLLSSLGIFGAHKENAVALGVFLVLMLVGAIFLFIRGIQVALLASEARQAVESELQNRPDWDTMMKAVDDIFRAALGMTFGFSAAGILGVILSACLLRQIGWRLLQPSLSDRVTVPSNAVPTTHDPMINAVPVPCYPSLA